MSDSLSRRVFSTAGFDNFKFHLVHDILNLMKKNFMPIMKRQFEQSPHEIGIQGLIPIAKPHGL